MLNFKLNPNAIDSNSTAPLADYLRSLGIEAVEEFMKVPNRSNELDGELLENALHTVAWLNKLFTENKKFFLIVDCDTDGFTSSAIFYNYFKKLFPDADIQWMLHEEKQHGIELDKIPEDREVIIVPDAGSNQLHEMEVLNAQGKYVFIMDHHQVEKPIPVGMEYITVVNNQTSDLFSNKALSGAGVTFKIVQLYDKVYNWHGANELYDLAALGIIADCMDSRTLDNNYIIYRGLNNVVNPMFKALLDKQAYSIEGDIPTKIDVAFYIAPLINGTIRMGTMEEKELLFRGFIETKHTEFYPHEWRGTTTMEDFYHRSARIAYNVKNEQNRLKMKCLEFLQKRVEENGLNNNQIIAVVVSDDDEVVVPKTITGLVAMELLRLYGKPSLVLRPVIDAEGNKTFAGSGRSYSYEQLPSFLQFVRDQEESVYAQGHSCAFGASIKAEEFEHFIETCNEKMSHIDFSNNAIMVDAIFENNINPLLIYEFAQGKAIYGNSIPQPQIAVRARVNKNDIRIMGKDASSIRITIKNIPFVKFKDAELAKKLQSASNFIVTVIGKPALNTYNGATTSQVKITDIEVEPIANTGGLF